MVRKPGRPMKYGHFLLALEDAKIYSPATIVHNGAKLGFFHKKLKENAFKTAKLRVRHTLARFSFNHHFPYEGDGFIRVEGQAPIRGWTGKRWKAAMAT